MGPASTTAKRATAAGNTGKIHENGFYEVGKLFFHFYFGGGLDGIIIYFHRFKDGTHPPPLLS